MFHGDSLHIEHHLWPAMSFVNLQQASRIVKSTCEEHGVPYHEISYLQGYAKIYQQVREHAAPTPRVLFVDPLCDGQLPVQKRKRDYSPCGHESHGTRQRLNDARSGH